MNKQQYNRYLQSPHWKSLRRKKQRIQRYCQCCGDREDLQRHHKTYARLGHEKLSDIQVLCGENNRNCHYVWHERQKGIGHIRPSYIIHRIYHTYLHMFFLPFRPYDG